VSLKSSTCCTCFSFCASSDWSLRVYVWPGMLSSQWCTEGRVKGW